MRALLLVALILPALFPCARAQDDDDTPPLERHLAGLSLGDSFDRVRRAYPPAKEWTSTLERRTGVARYRVESGDAKSFPPGLQILFLGFKRKRLVEIEAVYDEEKSRVSTVEKVAGQYALIYGEAKKSDERRFWWSDGSTVLRVFPAEIPLSKDDAHAVAWRTGVQIFNRGLARSE